MNKIRDLPGRNVSVLDVSQASRDPDLVLLQCESLLLLDQLCKGGRCCFGTVIPF